MRHGPVSPGVARPPRSDVRGPRRLSLVHYRVSLARVFTAASLFPEALHEPCPLAPEPGFLAGRGARTAAAARRGSPLRRPAVLAGRRGKTRWSFHPLAERLYRGRRGHL